MTIKTDVHDIVKLKLIDESHFDRLLPSWALESLCAAPYAVVRRGGLTQIHGIPRLPVGIRGESRNHRFGAFMKLENVEKVISPEQIVQEKMWLKAPGSKWGALLERTDKTLRKWEYPLEWGPGGSVGFELVTEHKATTGQSDIDLVIKPKALISSAEAGQLLKELREKVENEYSTAVDAVMRTGKGWVSLAEYAGGSGLYLVKTETGEELTRDLWQNGLAASKGRMI